MKLTGKAKEDFEKWLDSNDEIQDTANRDSLMHHWLTFKGFGSLAKSMQYGVYVDWFDSVGVNISLQSFYYADLDSFRYWVSIRDILKHKYLLDTRQEARLKAIEKANEIYNKQN